MALSEIRLLPPEARLWVFGSDRSLSRDESDHVTDTLARFIDTWTAHSAELTAAFGLLENHFVLVALDESRAAASGCSIDTLIRQLTELGRELGVELLDGRLVWYRNPSGDIVACDREEFRRLGQRGEVDGQTVVFDTTLDRLSEWRSDRFERPAAETWHVRLLEPSGVGGRARQV